MRQERNIKYFIVFLIIFLAASLLSAASGISNSHIINKFDSLVQQKTMEERSNPERKIKKQLYYDRRIGKNVEIAKGEILVKFKPSISALSINALNVKHKVQTLTIIKKLNIHQLKIPKEKTIEELIQEYGKDPSVEYVEPNFILYAFSTTPNDPYYSNQWGLSKIQAELGWDITQGSSNVVIAIVDSGIDLNHPDLSSKIWNNADEISGNGVDDDGNGYVDDYRGWSFAYDDNWPQDFDGHGSHVAGISGASSNNSIGVAGTSWNSLLMPVGVFDVWNNALTSWIVNGINYAADNGAKIINLSLGGDSYSSSFNDAVQYAHNKGCVIVAAVGNDYDSTIKYPAGYSNVIGVGATDALDNRASYSNYNSTVDVSAPGGDGSPYDSGDIYSTYYDDTYAYIAGTSMAAPFVSGLAALIFSQNPSWTNTQVENKIIFSADDLGSAGRDDYYGYGRINMFRALDTVAPPPPTLNPISSTTTVANPTISGTMSADTAEILINDSSSGVSYSSLALSSSTSWSYIASLSLGVNNFSIVARDAASNESSAVTLSITLQNLNIYPNPFRLGSSAGVIFAGLTGDEIIRIYTIAGELVISHQISGTTTWTWDAKNAAGNQVARGIYIYLITNSSGFKKIGKIAII